MLGVKVDVGEEMDQLRTRKPRPCYRTYTQTALHCLFVGSTDYCAVYYAVAGDTAKLAEFARTSSHGVDDYDDEGQTALHLAADQGLAEAVSLLTHSGANINVPREEDNRTPLHIAGVACMCACCMFRPQVAEQCEAFAYKSSLVLLSWLTNIL